MWIVNPGAEVFCFVLAAFQDSFILCFFFFTSLQITARHPGIVINVAEFRELFSYQGTPADISVPSQDVGFQLFQISALSLFLSVCFVPLEKRGENTAVGHLVYTFCAASCTVYQAA